MSPFAAWRSPIFAERRRRRRSRRRIRRGAAILDDAIAERRHLRDVAVIPRKVFEEKPELRPLFDVRLDVTAKAATRRETERCVRVAGAFLAVARAAARARAFLVPIADAAEAKIRALMEELEMGTNGPQDPFREEGGTLRPGGDGGRVERRQLALDAELGQLERSAALVRAAVGRLEADRERVMREYEAKVRFENQEDMRRLEEEMRRAFKRADESYALGARNASRLENWKAAPFARNIMSSFRFTLGVKRQFESLVDDLVLEVAEEAFPDAVRETSDEVNAAVDALFASETEATRDAFNRRPTEEGVRDNPLFDDEDDWDDARTPACRARPRETMRANANATTIPCRRRPSSSPRLARRTSRRCRTRTSTTIRERVGWRGCRPCRARGACRRDRRKDCLRCDWSSIIHCAGGEWPPTCVTRARRVGNQTESKNVRRRSVG